jgi:L-amino acid N-acyltransferase YncA
LVSTAFSSFIHDHQLEIGIETSENSRGKKFAMVVCSSLIDYCLENNYEPIWACRAENIGSYKLAVTLGFEPIVSIPYYKLNV